MRRSTSGYVTNVDKVRNYKDVLADVKVGLVNFFEEQLTALEWSRRRLMSKESEHLIKCANHRGDNNQPAELAKDCLQGGSKYDPSKVDVKDSNCRFAEDMKRWLIEEDIGGAPTMKNVVQQRVKEVMKIDQKCHSHIDIGNLKAPLKRRCDTGYRNTRNAQSAMQLNSGVKRSQSNNSFSQGSRAQTNLKLSYQPLRVTCKKLKEDEIMSLMKPSPIKIVSCNRLLNEIELIWQRVNNNDFKKIEIFADGKLIQKVEDVHPTRIILNANIIDNTKEQLISISAIYNPRSVTDYFFYEMEHHHYFPRKSMLSEMMARKAQTQPNISNTNVGSSTRNDMQEDTELSEEGKQRLAYEKKILKYENKIRKTERELRLIDPSFSRMEHLHGSSNSSHEVNEVATAKEKMLNGDLFIKNQQNKELEEKLLRMKQDYDKIEREYNEMVEYIEGPIKETAELQLKRIQTLEGEVTQLREALRENEETYHDKIESLDRLMSKTRSSIAQIENKSKNSDPQADRVEPKDRGQRRRRPALPLNWSPNSSQSVDQEDSVEVRVAPATTHLTTDTKRTPQLSRSPEKINMNKNRKDAPTLINSAIPVNLPSAGQANLEGELNKIIFNDGKVPPDSYEGNSTDTTEENMPVRKKKRRSVSDEVLPTAKDQNKPPNDAANILVPLYQNIEIINTMQKDIQVAVEVSKSGLLYITTDVPINEETEELLRTSYDKLSEMNLEDLRHILNTSNRPKKMKEPSNSGMKVSENSADPKDMIHDHHLAGGTPDYNENYDDENREDDDVEEEKEVEEPTEVIMAPPEHIEEKGTKTPEKLKNQNVEELEVLKNNENNESAPSLRPEDAHNDIGKPISEATTSGIIDSANIHNLIEATESLQEDLKTSLSRSRSLQLYLQGILTKSQTLSKHLLNSGTSVITGASLISEREPIRFEHELVDRESLQKTAAPAKQPTHICNSDSCGIWKREMPTSNTNDMNTSTPAIEKSPTIEALPSGIISPDKLDLELAEIPTNDKLVNDVLVSDFVEKMPRESFISNLNINPFSLSGLKQSLGGALRNVSLFRTAKSDTVLDREVSRTTESIEHDLKEQRKLIDKHQKQINANEQSLTTFAITTEDLMNKSRNDDPLERYNLKNDPTVSETMKPSDAFVRKGKRDKEEFKSLADFKHRENRKILVSNKIVPKMTEQEFMSHRLPSPVKITDIQPSHDNRLIISWKIFAVEQVKGYELFCDGSLVRRVNVPIRDSCIIKVPDAITEQLISIYAIPDSQFLYNGKPFHFSPHSFYYVPKKSVQVN